MASQHSLEAFCSEGSFKALFDETINVLQPISDRPSILFRHGKRSSHASVSVLSSRWTLAVL